MFKTLMRPDCMFLEGLSHHEVKLFRKRSIEVILATDMARHFSDFGTLKDLIKLKEISKGKNSERLLNKDSEVELFNSQ
jgi:hypothetical protein